MLKSKIFVMFIVTLLVAGLVLSGCGNSSSNSSQTPAKQTEKKDEGQKLVIKLGIGSALTSQLGEYAVKFKEILESKSNGQIEVQIFPNGQMGNDKSMMESLQMGTLDMTAPSTAPIANFIKDFLYFDLPMLVDDDAAAKKLLTSDLAKESLKKLDSIGIVGLDYWVNGFRNITNSKRPVKTAADIKGLKIRTMQNPIHIDFFNALGANATPMAFNEVFNALEQKVIDGQENPISLIYTSGFHEVNKYVTLSRHVFTPYVAMISKKTWEKITPEQQKLIQEAATEVANQCFDILNAQESKFLEDMKSKGNVIDELSPEGRTQLQNTAKEIWKKYESEIGKDTMQKVMSIIGKSY